MAGGEEHVMVASREEMMAAKLPLAARDYCAHLLIPLNKCRIDKFYLPWNCEMERHGYEKCEYELFMERVKKMTALREEKLVQGTTQLQPSS